MLDTGGKYSLQQISSDGSFRRRAAGAQQRFQLPYFRRSEVAQLFAVDLTYRAVEPGEQRQSPGRNANEDPAAVRVLPEPRNQASFLEAIEQPRNIGIAGNHALRDLTAQQTFGCAAQDAEDVVLGSGKLDGAQQPGRPAREQVDGAGHFNEERLFGAVSRGPMGRGSRHEPEI
jgi:hypothetical protein